MLLTEASLADEMKRKVSQLENIKQVRSSTAAEAAEAIASSAAVGEGERAPRNFELNL